MKRVILTTMIFSACGNASNSDVPVGINPSDAAEKSDTPAKEEEKESSIKESEKRSETKIAIDPLAALVVDGVDGLGECKADIKNALRYVKATSQFFVCTDKWEPVEIVKKEEPKPEPMAIAKISYCDSSSNFWPAGSGVIQRGISGTLIEYNNGLLDLSCEFMNAFSWVDAGETEYDFDKSFGRTVIGRKDLVNGVVGCNSGLGGMDLLIKLENYDAQWTNDSTELIAAGGKGMQPALCREYYPKKSF